MNYSEFITNILFGHSANILKVKIIIETILFLGSLGMLFVHIIV